MSDDEYARLLANQAAARVLDEPSARRMRKPAQDLSERKLAEIGTNILVQDGWRALPMEPMSRRSWGKGSGEIGMPDCLYIRYRPPCGRAGLAELLWIEWKRPGGVVADHQRRWHEIERARGARVVVSTEDFPATPDGFADWYRDSGLKRR